MSSTEAMVEPLALVKGVPWVEVPKDLYIPPEALRVVLEAFEGPLDLLLYLIKRENIDILDIPMAHITRQYIEYIQVMRVLRLELAGEYLLMAAMLQKSNHVYCFLSRPPRNKAKILIHVLSWFAVFWNTKKLKPLPSPSISVLLSARCFVR